MIGYILTPTQYLQIQGQFYSGSQFFNCVKDINGVWFLLLSTQDKQELLATEWEWILALPVGDFVPPAPKPFPS